MERIYNFGDLRSLPTYSDIKAMDKNELENFHNAYKKWTGEGNYCSYALSLACRAFDRLHPKKRKKIERAVKKLTIRDIFDDDEL